MNITYILFINLVMSYTNETLIDWELFHINLERAKIDPEKVACENNVKKIKAEQAYAERIYECAKNLPRPTLIHTGYDVESFKSAVKHYDEEMVAYNTMLVTLKKEVTDAENRLLEEQTKYYSI